MFHMQLFLHFYIYENATKINWHNPVVEPAETTTHSANGHFDKYFDMLSNRSMTAGVFLKKKGSLIRVTRGGWACRNHHT